MSRTGVTLISPSGASQNDESEIELVPTEEDDSPDDETQKVVAPSPVAQ